MLGASQSALYPSFVRAFVLALALTPVCVPTTASPQATLPAASDQLSPLLPALLGTWVGVLEYRDFSEPAGSTNRIQLPTWLTVASAPRGLSLDYTYDDGPAKTVTEHSALLLDAQARTYTTTNTDAVREIYTISGLETLKDGRGTLILTGSGTDNKLPAEIRTTWTIRRNLLSWLEEVRPAGSSQSFAFRHRYTFTRATPPTSGTP